MAHLSRLHFAHGSNKGADSGESVLELCAVLVANARCHCHGVYGDNDSRSLLGCLLPCCLSDGGSLIYEGDYILVRDGSGIRVEIGVRVYSLWCGSSGEAVIAGPPR